MIENLLRAIADRPLMIFALIGLILISPFIFIFAVNGLFDLDIKFSIENWIYSGVIIMIVRK